MSPVTLPDDLNALGDQIAPSREAKLFIQDDLEFRTITTLLHLLGISERIDLDSFHVSGPERSHLKLLTALSALLVRHTETIAIMPKRSVLGTTLFVGSAVETMTRQYFPDDESTSPNIITRNPEMNDSVGPVKLLGSPTIEIGSNIFEFMLENWFVRLPIYPKPTPLTPSPRHLGSSHLSSMSSPSHTF